MAAPPGSSRDVAQSFLVDVRGPVAHVSVSRTLGCVPARSTIYGTGAAKPASDGPSDVVLDLALPPRSELLEVGLAEGGGPARRLRTPGSNNALASYMDGLRAMGLTAAEVSFEDEARYRIRVGCKAGEPRKVLTLTYDYSMLVEVFQGAPRLTFPAAAELSPPATRVEVRVLSPPAVAEISIAGAAHPVRSGAAGRAVETVSTRSPWVVAISPAASPTPPRVVASPGAAPNASDGTGPPRLLAMTAVGSRPAARPRIAYAVGAGPGLRQPLPERVLFVIDRSRSVGPQGLEGEREVARKVLEALPPSTRFDALFFDRAQNRLFPVARAATREAIAALEQEMLPARMANGTDLAAALRAAGEVLRQGGGEFSGRCLLVILTDGAVGTPANATRLPAALGQLPGTQLMTAVVSVRPTEDPPVSLGERQQLRSVAARAALGAVERTVGTGEISDAVPAFLESLRSGGDVYDIRLGGSAPGGKENAPVQVADVLEAGGGVAGIMALPSARAVPRSLNHSGLGRPIPLRPITVDGRWLEALTAPATPAAVPSSRPQPRFLGGSGLVALLEPVVRATARAPVADPLPRGYMERSVVRDALSLAFTPRARACYLNRTARTAAERDLTGRVRLALELVRGEVGGVKVESSSLAHAGIEDCLRQAAYAIEVPRAYRNDEAVSAVLNLVFRPRTPERERRPALANENLNLNREIDLMIEAALEGAADGGVDAGTTAPRDAGGSDGGRAAPAAAP